MATATARGKQLASGQFVLEQTRRLFTTKGTWSSFFADSFSTAQKSLENWTEEEVQAWLADNNYSEFSQNFVKLRGHGLASLSEAQFQKELGNLLGSALYNEVQALKASCID